MAAPSERPQRHNNELEAFVDSDFLTLVESDLAHQTETVLPSVQISGEDQDFIERVFSQVRDVDFRAPPPPPVALEGADKKVGDLREKVRKLERDLARVAYVWSLKHQQMSTLDDIIGKADTARRDALQTCRRVKEQAIHVVNAYKQQAQAAQALSQTLGARKAELELNYQRLSEDHAQMSSRLTEQVAKLEREQARSTEEYRQKLESAQTSFNQLREQSAHHLGMLQAQLQGREEENTRHLQEIARLKDLLTERDRTLETTRAAYVTEHDALRDSSAAALETLRSTTAVEYQKLKQHSETALVEQKAAADAKYEAQKSTAEANYEALKQSSQATLTEHKSAAETRYDTLKQNSEASLAEHKSAAEAAYDTLKHNSEAALAEMKRASDANYDALKESTSAALADLKTSSDAAYDALRMQSTAKYEALLESSSNKYDGLVQSSAAALEAQRVAAAAEYAALRDTSTAKYEALAESSAATQESQRVSAAAAMETMRSSTAAEYAALRDTSTAKYDAQVESSTSKYEDLMQASAAALEEQRAAAATAYETLRTHGAATQEELARRLTDFEKTEAVAHARIAALEEKVRERDTHVAQTEQRFADMDRHHQQRISTLEAALEQSQENAALDQKALQSQLLDAQKEAANNQARITALEVETRAREESIRSVADRLTERERTTAQLIEEIGIMRVEQERRLTEKTEALRASYDELARLQGGLVMVQAELSQVKSLHDVAQQERDAFKKLVPPDGLP